MNKILSVIIPLYNSAQWVEKCLDSVLNQDIPVEQMEIICINDGSPDNSADIVRDKSEEVRSKNGYSPIVVLEQENQGPSGARNNGMRHATGKYLMFVDPDDYVEPNTFGGLIEQMEREQLDMLRFNFNTVDEYDTVLPVRGDDAAFDYTPELMTGAEFLANRLGIGCNIWRYVYRTEIITKNEIWCYTGDYFDDTPWLPLVLLKAERMNVVDTIVYDYLERSDGLVKATNPRTIQRKIDGHVLLQKYLIDGLERLEDASQEARGDRQRVIAGVKNWYKKMIAFSVVKWMNLVAIYQYENNREAICRLKSNGLLPLNFTKLDRKMQRHACMINISPRMYVDLLHLKNRKKSRENKNLHK